ncbi:transcriptional regulator [Streptantibioticus cattleyicolor NRRL 8057 = DSM 46488]|uniref:Transcriptional regulator n=2 Tax=Kitasatosporales TaxID=85011 RepID=G8WX30_STREN|nr:transcriptional regulator [Streptantibioticus cattleyicolor NRRL 8057 = DSM 46488]MYS60471.1 AAA family ATPase [Streptomyces sp. SID5468]
MLTECAKHEGSVAVIRGSTATGKTELLHALGESAANNGFRVLNALAGPMERSFPYALLEQIFPDLGPLAPPAAGNFSADSAPETPDEHPVVPPSVLRHVHRTATELAARQPLFIGIDDVHHADPASLQCLLYLIRRFRSSAIALAVTDNLHDPGGRTFFGELQYQPRILRVMLGVLSPAGVAGMVAQALGAKAADRFAGEFNAVSGGNPLLLRALLNDTLAHDDAPGFPRPHPADAFQHAALACVRRSGPDSVRVAHGVALLDRATPVPLLSDLVGVGPRTTEEVLRLLTDSGLLDDGRFRHPALRTAVLHDLPRATANELRSHAARLLRTSGAPATAVAEHLLECGPLREPWEAPLLRAAADQYLGDGKAVLAAGCLELASRCGSDDDQQRLADLSAAANITWRLDPKATALQLESLATAAREGTLPSVMMLRLIRTFLWWGLEEEAVSGTGRLPAEDADPEYPGELLTTWLRLATTYPGALARMSGPLGPNPPVPVPPVAPTDTLHLHAGRALYTALRGGDADAVVTGAEHVLQRVRLSEQSLELPMSALHALVYLDRLDAAETGLDRLLTQSGKHHTPAWDALFTSTQALIGLRRGDLPGALRQARDALTLMPTHGWGVGVALPLATLIETYTAMGRHDAAAEVIEQPLPEGTGRTRFGLHHRYARGLHHLAVEQYQSALACFLSCGEDMTAWRVDCPGLVPWRSGAAEVWLRFGKPERAVALLTEELARTGAAAWRTRAAALRLLAAARPSDRRPRQLSEALTAARTAGDRYTMTRVLADLGHTQQQLGNGTEARQLIRRAWRLAQECGAEQIQRSLLPASARPAPTLPTDQDADPLTDAERRVASLAAQGFTNREVAAKLFITVSTVEQHLTRVYRKFRIKHREQLPTSLGLDVARQA